MTPREMADACCDQCRALKGAGPWCPYCGDELPGAARFDDEWFAQAMCDECDEIHS